ncbi:DUF6151 family protein [Roseateles asaccharophilus]|uniref:CENP-V/GFA domain-containing protein n=1 Tax=Roseateles asaccharophilus TaxID=582607 RepID=A0ABU2AFI1_9BURK|nr:DUF6151 family protein [Roseateles asaccharophilus]MDR7335735.1 hypothetical protein [Roseateles asaccharophilus]
MKSHPISCRCGTVRGHVARPDAALRLVCYCRDCQAFARYLGPPPGMLDAMNGTEILAVRPSDVSFTQGQDRLACMSLSDKGLLRWYASCCRSPMGSTPRDPRESHLGLVHSCLEADEARRADVFGPVRMRVNTQAANGRPEKNAVLTFAAALAGHLGGLLWRRLSGSYRANPFFGPDGAPIAQPQVVLAEQREALRQGG